MTRQKLFLNIKYYFSAAQLSLDQTAATSLNIPEAWKIQMTEKTAIFLEYTLFVSKKISAKIK